MTIKLVPLGNRVLLRKIETNTRGGLALPPSSEIDEGTQECEVVAISETADIFKDEAKFFAIGNRIYLARHKGWKIETDSGEELYVAEVDDVLAVEVEVESSFPGGGDPQVACSYHKTGEATGELHEPHSCPKCGIRCDGDSPCLAEEVQS